MIRVSVHPENPQMRFVNQTIEVLKAGGVICYPTDTIYGIGCDIFNKKAVEKIHLLKGKNSQPLLSFIVPNLKDIAQYAHVGTPAYKLLRRLLPGPFTFILEATKLVPKIMMSKRRTVGIRIPDEKTCLLLMKEFNSPIVSTSTSIRGGDILNQPDDIERVWGHAIDYFLDCGPTGLESSTVVDLTGTEPIILRKGKGEPQLIY